MAKKKVPRKPKVREWWEEHLAVCRVAHERRIDGALDEALRTCDMWSVRVPRWVRNAQIKRDTKAVLFPGAQKKDPGPRTDFCRNAALHGMVQELIDRDKVSQESAAREVIENPDNKLRYRDVTEENLGVDGLKKIYREYQKLLLAARLLLR